MRISVDDIRVKMAQLMDGTASRDEVSEWATRLMDDEDRGRLHYHPNSDEKDIWEALIFLRGIDLKDSPSSYLHELEEVQEYLVEHLEGQNE